MEQISSEEYSRIIQTEDKVILLDFWNENCGVCKQLSGVLEQLAEERTDIEVYGIQAEKSEALCSELAVMMVPSILFIKNGEIRKRTLGFKSRKSLEDIIDNIG